MSNIDSTKKIKLQIAFAITLVSRGVVMLTAMKILDKEAANTIIDTVYNKLSELDEDYHSEEEDIKEYDKSAIEYIDFNMELINEKCKL